MDTTSLITRGESLFFIFYTLPTVYFLTISFVEQIKNLLRNPRNLRGLKITMICLRGTILAMVLAILSYNIVNYFGPATVSGDFLNILPYTVSTLLLLVSVVLWLQWKMYGRDK